MKYLCLAYEEEEGLNALSPSEWDALRGETLAYAEALRKSGHLNFTQARESARTGATVQVRSGKLSVTDGPFAETKEQLGGFFLIDARDLNEAIQVASRWPSARLGSIEARPIEGTAQTGQALRIITPPPLPVHRPGGTHAGSVGAAR